MRLQALRRRSCGEVVQHGSRAVQWAADEKDVVCESEVGEVRVGVVFGKFDSVIFLSSTFLTMVS